VADALVAVRILVADDEPDNVRLLERALATFGYREVRSTTNAAELVPLFRAFGPDLVLVDFHMPPLSGPELLARLLAELPPGALLPVLVITGDVTPEAQHRALAAGASEVILKPIELRMLRDRVARHLEMRRRWLAAQRPP
jgi:putative two-component system response regulator